MNEAKWVVIILGAFLLVNAAFMADSMVTTRSKERVMEACLQKNAAKDCAELVRK